MVGHGIGFQVVNISDAAALGQEIVLVNADPILGEMTAYYLTYQG